MSGRLAAPMEAATMANPTPEDTSQAGLIGSRRSTRGHDPPPDAAEDHPSGVTGRAEAGSGP
jgi:hypothetical protein